jgi:opacity protein-like surface antigen
MNFPGLTQHNTGSFFLIGLMAALSVVFGSSVASAQRVEITAFGGGQLNGGLDLSNPLFHRIEVHNGAAYGLAAGYALGDRYSLEFNWAYNKADAVGQPSAGGSDVKLFILDTNQYFGNFLVHLANREKRVRPFFLFGLGATNLSPAVTGINSATRFAFALGGGAKYNFSRRFGLRFQAKWSPTYITSTSDGYWCDALFGGCWAVSNSHYLHELDGTVGLTLRF